MANNLQTGDGYLHNANWDSATSAPPQQEISTGDSIGVIITVVIGVLGVISLLFFFAIFIDCRNQEEEAAKRKSSALRAVRQRRKIFKLSTFFHGRGANGDSLAFASHMCEENENSNPIILNEPVTTIVDITETTPSSSSVQY